MGHKQTFTPMDPAMIRKLIEGEEDVITPSAKLDAELYQNARCPTCGNTGADKVTMPPQVDLGEGGMPQVTRSGFGANSPIIQGHAKCQACQVEFNPVSGLIVRAIQPILTDVQQ